jgi:Putative phospholipid-binding domain.
MKRTLSLMTATMSIFALTALAGCSSPTSEATGEGVAERTGAAIDEAGAQVKEGAKEAVDATEKAAVEAGKEIQDAGDTASMTSRVRTAIVAADGLDIDDLNVDTMAESKKVVIRGKADTEAEKNRAGTVAKAAVDPNSGYTVDNQIVIDRD